MFENAGALPELAAMAIDANASDIHLTVDQYPFMRQSGKLMPIAQEKLTARFLEECLASMVNDDQQDLLSHQYSIDFSWAAAGRRFRGNAYFQRGELAIALRLIPDRIPSMHELRVPEALRRMVEERFIARDWTNRFRKIDDISLVREFVDTSKSVACTHTRRSNRIRVYFTELHDLTARIRSRLHEFSCGTSGGTSRNA